MSEDLYRTQAMVKRDSEVEAALPGARLVSRHCSASMFTV